MNFDDYDFRDERCWCHGFELGCCPVVDGDEPLPATQWAMWSCPRCNRDVRDHHGWFGPNPDCATLTAEYLALPWEETQGRLPE